MDSSTPFTHLLNTHTDSDPENSQPQQSHNFNPQHYPMNYPPPFFPNQYPPNFNPFADYTETGSTQQQRRHQRDTQQRSAAEVPSRRQKLHAGSAAPSRAGSAAPAARILARFSSFHRIHEAQTSCIQDFIVGTFLLWILDIDLEGICVR
ncbi:hypothetical protein EJB05_31024 [Eragrostis curvula]|uniref:Uncharacterized protein n=1 Tax=Eragrostis curvula TaxID=38414 RepID=A0A5J9UD38_9POAL|nr:hypothetical protein EJB05_31024 [Eragrostis curvula]